MNSKLQIVKNKDIVSQESHFKIKKGIGMNILMRSHIHAISTKVNRI